VNAFTQSLIYPQLIGICPRTSPEANAGRNFTQEIRRDDPTHRRLSQPEGGHYVIAVNFPEQVTAQHSHILFRTLAYVLTLEQPFLSLDFSRMRSVDTVGLDVLLGCLEETVRRDGAIQINGVSPEAAVIFEITGIDRILSTAGVRMSSTRGGEAAQLQSGRLPLDGTDSHDQGCVKPWPLVDSRAPIPGKAERKAA
jgi:anti-anti-sigma regulatory factor